MYSEALQIVIPLLTLVVGVAVGHWWHNAHQSEVRDWPRAFNLHARPLFTTEERLMFRELKLALPNHVVLAKLNLLRFCQADRESEARVWFDRLHTLNVSFAVCTPNGTVVSVIDLDTPNRAISARSQRVKAAALDACRIRYLRCQVGQRPDSAILAQWALGATPSAEVVGTSPLVQARAELAQKLNRRREERATRQKDSTFADSGFADSFFAFDAPRDTAANSAAVPLDLRTSTGH